MATPPEQPDIEMQEAEEEDFLIEEHPRLLNVEICKILIFKTLSTLSDLDQTQEMYQWLMYLSWWDQAFNNGIYVSFIQQFYFYSWP